MTENEFFDAMKRWMDQPRIRIPNPERIKVLSKAVDDLQKVLEVESENIWVDMSPVPDGDGCVLVEMDWITVRNIPQFSKIMVEFKNFEVFPLENGKIRLTATFGDVEEVSVLPSE